MPRNIRMTPTLLILVGILSYHVGFRNAYASSLEEVLFEQGWPQESISEPFASFQEKMGNSGDYERAVAKIGEGRSYDCDAFSNLLKREGSQFVLREHLLGLIDGILIGWRWRTHTESGLNCVDADLDFDGTIGFSGVDLNYSEAIVLFTAIGFPFGLETGFPEETRIKP